MKLGFVFCACSLLLGCDQGKTDIGDLPAGSESGGETGGETGVETEGPACAGPGENCEMGCCDGFGCNFMTVCEACTPEGEIRSIDGAGCCEGLATAPTMLCFDSACDAEGCGETGACRGLEPAIHDDSQQYVYDCEPEVCTSTDTLVLSNEAGAPGLQCAGPGGSSECAATGGALQQYVYEDELLQLTVRFDAAILDGYSTASFNEYFDGVAGQLTVQGFPQVTAFVETGSVTELVYADGRLQFTIVVPLEDPFVVIESDAEDCLLDDIAGECACYYEALPPFFVVVDLAIESP